MRFGLTSEEYDYINRQVVLPLRAKGAEVWCFGSRARGTHHRFSDLDLMVETHGNPQLSKSIAEMQELLSKSQFPYKVDMVSLSEFAESYLENFHQEKIRF